MIAIIFDDEHGMPRAYAYGNDEDVVRTRAQAELAQYCAKRGTDPKDYTERREIL
jgi:hypothetical protein